MRENIKGQPRNKKTVGRKVQSPNRKSDNERTQPQNRKTDNRKNYPQNKKIDIKRPQNQKRPKPVAYEYTDEEYRRLLAKKQDEMKKLLSGFAPVDPIVGMEDPYYYRNKVCAEFRKLKNGTIISGRYQEGTHNVVETKGCKIEDQRADAIIQDITGLFQDRSW